MLIKVDRYSVECDKCRCKLWYMGKYFETSNKVYLKEIAVSQGWSYGKSHYCEKCKKV